jgi:hypothetical protein
MNDRKLYYQLIPEKIKEALPAIEGIMAPEIKGYSRDCLKEVISIVACHVRKDEEATPLKMTYIKKLVPQGDKYLTALIDLGIIERTGYYVPGQAAYRYSFAPDYESKYIASFLDNAKLTRRIEKVFEQFTREATKKVRGHSEQVMYLRRLTIAPGFMKFINENYSTDTDAFNKVLASATRIMNGDIFYKVDNTSGRFHSNVTNCTRGFRPYLRVNGEPLVNLDVKNCQPYLSTIILTDPLKASTFTENRAFAMVLQTLKVSQNEDVINYISLVINGTFYEYLMKEFAAEGLHLDRSETKKQVLRILFARNRMPKNPINDTDEIISKLSEKKKKKREGYIKEYATIKKAREIFKDRFPTVHRIFSKVRGSERGDRFTSFKRFAILLQRMESYLMLDVVLKRVYRELPGVVAITIHDSIMTGVLTNNVEAVKNILTEELTNFVGFRPNVNIEGIIEEEEGEGRGKRGEEIKKQYDATTLISVN